MDQEAVGKFIAALRKEKDMTQEQMGERLGVSQRTVSRWETGKNMPDISLLSAIGELLDVSVTELLQGKRLDDTISRQEAADSNRSLIALALRKRSSKSLITALLATIVTLTCMIALYNYEFPWNVTSTEELELAIDDYHFANEMHSDVKERTMIDDHLIVLFGQDGSTTGGGIAVLERGVFGKYRMISATDIARPLYHVSKLEVGRSSYLLVYALNSLPEIASVKLFANDEADTAPVYTTKAEKAPCLTAVEIDPETQVQLSPYGMRYYDAAGKELPREELWARIDWDEDAPTPGYGTAELGTIYVLEIILLLFGLIFVRHHLSKKE